jgi:hypothetical protein
VRTLRQPRHLCGIICLLIFSVATDIFFQPNFIHDSTTPSEVDNSEANYQLNKPIEFPYLLLQRSVHKAVSGFVSVMPSVRSAIKNLDDIFLPSRAELFNHYRIIQLQVLRI